ncbi:MAG: hypothetical protein ACLSCV_11650 [Acutalibacteraceae bacterium]
MVEPGYLHYGCKLSDKVCISQGRISDGVLPITCCQTELSYKLDANTTNSTLDGMTR